MLEVTALPQSTAAVERTFSKISNKTKLRNALSVHTVEAIVRTSDYFSTNFDVDDKLVGQCCLTQCFHRLNISSSC